MARQQKSTGPGFEDAAFDFAEPTAPSRTCMVASTPRAGGTYFAHALWRTGVMGAPTEYFGFYSTMLHLVARFKPDTLQAYLDEMMPLRTTANGVFGVKLHYDHLQFILLSGMLNQFKNLSVIAIDRQDRLAQAVSHARALQTGQWTSLHGARSAEPSYNADLIRWCLDHIDAQRRGWQAFFAQHKISPIPVDYDAFVADPAGIAKDIVARTGVPTSPVSPVDLPAIARQSDGLNAEWAARFRNEAGSGGA